MSEFTTADHQFMQHAISLARLAHYTTSPNPRVGCILVKNNVIVGEGYHQRAGLAHAEVNALAQAGENAKGATAYVTLEPCSHYGRTPPCAEGLINAGVKKVIAAMVDPNPQVSGKGLAMLEQAGIDTSYGLLEQEAQNINTGFVKLMTTNFPYIRCKLAASLDGKTAMASGESQWITSVQSRQDVQRLRAQSCAIISGADSVITDNAQMTVRWSELGELKNSYDKNTIRQPLRVIIDSRNRITPDLKLFKSPSPILLICHTIENIHQWPHFVEQVSLPLVKNAQGDNKIDLITLVKLLGGRGVNDILVESGQNLAGAFIEQDLVDELVLYQAPKLMGAQGKSLMNFPNITSLSQAKELNIKDVRMVGADIRITAKLLN